MQITEFYFRNQYCTVCQLSKFSIKKKKKAAHIHWSAFTLC